MSTRSRGKRRNKPVNLTNVMKVSAVVWSASMLTAYYAKILPQMDATFMAGLLTSTLGSLGVDVMRKNDEDKTPPSTPTIPPKAKP